MKNQLEMKTGGRPRVCLLAWLLLPTALLLATARGSMVKAAAPLAQEPKVEPKQIEPNKEIEDKLGGKPLKPSREKEVEKAECAFDPRCVATKSGGKDEKEHGVGVFASSLGSKWEPKKLNNGSANKVHLSGTKGASAGALGRPPHPGSFDFFGVLHTGSFGIIRDHLGLYNPFPRDGENVVVMKGELPVGSSLQRFTEVNSGFIKNFPSPHNLRQLNDSKVLFLSSARDGGEETLAVLDAPRSVSSNRLVMDAEVISRDPKSSHAALERRLKELGPDSRVYLYGDDIKSLPIESMIRNAGAQLVRRSQVPASNGDACCGPSPPTYCSGWVCSRAGV